MHLYTALTGHDITYPDPPTDVAAFLARAKAAVEDPDVSADQMVSLIYGLENPILDPTVMPGRAMVTERVLDNPLYDVLADLVARKEVALGLFDVEKMLAAHTVSVPVAAEQLGLTQQAVRQAIDYRRLPAVRKNGQWWIRPEAVDTFTPSRAGRPKKAAARKPVEVRMGGEPGRSLSVRLINSELSGVKKDGGARLATFPAEWPRAVVKTTDDTGTRAYDIVPASAAGEIAHGGLYVRGGFKVVDTHTTTAGATAAWKAAETAEV